MKHGVIAPTLLQEQEAHADGVQAIGIDEAGRGPLAGPVVAAAALLKDWRVAQKSIEALCAEDSLWRFVRDSKTLSPQKRVVMDAFVRTHFFVGIGLCDHETIDRMNILEASFLAMKKAVTDLVQRQEKGVAVRLLVDGSMEIPQCSWAQRAIPQGDAHVVSIAAASIVAKVARDAIMAAVDVEYPAYGFARHQGYGTAAHLAALRQWGPTPYHRRSFAPVRAVVRELRQYGVDV